MIKKIFLIILKKLKIVRNSYSYYIYKNKSEFLIKKIFEEFQEMLTSYYIFIKKKNCINKYFFIKEICDLIFHLILFFVFNKINIQEIEKEIIRRTYLSGINEKKKR